MSLLAELKREKARMTAKAKRRRRLQQSDPLLPGSSEAIISANIAELRHHGHKQAQAVAIALKEARKSRR